MAKQYLATEDILRRAENKVKRRYQTDCGLFDWDQKPTKSMTYAFEKLVLVTQHFEAELAKGLSEKDAKAVAILAYNREAIGRGVSQKNRDLIREALELVINEAAESKSDEDESKSGFYWQRGQYA